MINGIGYYNGRDTYGRESVYKKAKALIDYQTQWNGRDVMMSRIRKCRAYVDGDQWLDSRVMQDLKRIGATPKTTNITKTILETYVNFVVSHSQRSRFEAKENTEEAIELSENLTNLYYDIQQLNHIDVQTRVATEYAFRDGISVRESKYVDNKIVTKVLPIDGIFFDRDDDTDDFTNQKTVINIKYVHYLDLIQTYPKFKARIKKIWNNGESDNTNPFFYKESIDINVDANVKGNKLKIYEIYYKDISDYYEVEVDIAATPTEKDDQVEGIDASTKRYIYRTFDEEVAKEKSKIAGTKIIKKRGTEIFKIVLHDDLLLESGSIVGQVPNQADLPYIFQVYNRDRDGIIMSWVWSMIDPQDMRNLIFSKFFHLLGMKHVFVSSKNTNTEIQQQKLNEALRAKYHVLGIEDPREMQITDYDDSVGRLVNFLPIVDNTIEQITGLPNEAKGESSNIISGVGIQARYGHIEQSQSGVIEKNRYHEIRFAVLILNTIQGISNLKYTFKIFNLNKGVRQDITLDDKIAMYDFEVYPDIGPNFASSYQEEQAAFNRVVSDPNKDMLLRSPLYLQYYGMSQKQAFEVNNEYMRIITPPEQQQMQAQIAPEQNDMLNNLINE